MQIKTSLSLGAGIFAALGLIALSVFLLPPVRAADKQNPKTEAQARAVSYHIDKQVVAYRTSLAAADTDDSATWGSIPEYGLEGNPNIIISGRFSGAAADTATLKIAYYYRQTDGALIYKGSSAIITLVALAGIDGNNDNEAPLVGLDGRGSNTIKVILLTISAGNIDLWVGSH